MTRFDTRDLGARRGAALAEEAQSRGMSVPDLVRQFIDEGIARTQAHPDREAWIAEARQGLAFEAEHLATNGPSLARYRRVRAGS
jgi:post-segregation antitoxin (ccd killing protein)